MSRLLYLDTARLGQMSPTALKTHCDFVRLMAEDPSSLYTEQFLFDGSAASPDIATRFPELARWSGIEELKQQLRDAFAAKTDSDTEVLLASRTTSLMQLSIRSLAANGRRHLLLTDLTWRPYRKWIQRFACRRQIKLTVLPLRQRIWQQGFTADDVATTVVSELQRTNADSLFLPAVTHTGIRMPLPRILQSMSDGPSSVWVIIDASQAYGHTNTNEWARLADFTFGGCHKWVRSYLPLSVGFARQHDRTILRRKMSRDPLCQFCDTTGVGKASMETVNVTSLLTAQSAVTDLMLCSGKSPFTSETWEFQTHSRRIPTWPVLTRHHTLSSNIVLLQSASSSVRNLPNERLRQMLAEHGISATTYGSGVIRISVPHASHSSPGETAHQLAARLSRFTSGPKAKFTPSSRRNESEMGTVAPVRSPRTSTNS